ncbi:phosphotransferase [Streptomyces sp. NBC_01233]|uniref:phosphotransferase n=1 Tax=Streptomyces sp. NBC_01233 TaxID=2903787 RepID=UPI002E0ED26D|nr:phosphotransferase [Streptomyces sp. NBC_01233]
MSAGDPLEVSADLQRVAAAFGLGTVTAARFLADGLMNNNWRVETDAGVFAVKQIRDVPLPTARRNLRVLGELAAQGLPVSAPVQDAGRSAVVEFGSAGYCVLPWIDGEHLAGSDMSTDQVVHLGVVLGQIHQALNQEAVLVNLPALPTSLPASVPDPAQALAEADRYLAVIRARREPLPCDVEVAGLLEERKILIREYAAARSAATETIASFGWTHGDVQYLNLLWRDGRVRGVTDWDRMRPRAFGEEMARTATLMFSGPDGAMDLVKIAALVTGYRSVLPIGVTELADAVERLWWKRVSDLWHLVFHNDRSDHSSDHLFAAGEALTDWWTERRDLVQAAFAVGS